MDCRPSLALLVLVMAGCSDGASNPAVPDDTDAFPNHGVYQTEGPDGPLAIRIELTSPTPLECYVNRTYNNAHAAGEVAYAEVWTNGTTDWLVGWQQLGQTVHTGALVASTNVVPSVTGPRAFGWTESHHIWPEVNATRWTMDAIYDLSMSYDVKVDCSRDVTIAIYRGTNPILWSLDEFQEAGFSTRSEGLGSRTMGSITTDLPCAAEAYTYTRDGTGTLVVNARPSPWELQVNGSQQYDRRTLDASVVRATLDRTSTSPDDAFWLGMACWPDEPVAVS